MYQPRNVTINTKRNIIIKRNGKINTKMKRTAMQTIKRKRTGTRNIKRKNPIHTKRNTQENTKDKPNEK